MAEPSASGTYVKIMCHIWYDKKGKNVHITSSDKDLPKTHMHMTAKKGTQSDTNLRALLNKFGCGPDAAEAKPDPLTKASNQLDEIIENHRKAGLNGSVRDLLALQETLDSALPEVIG